uniref:Uncharacterized protein n=1 Tax=Nelumbo nucifera TaxID=4432 RepID=A0A822ZSJ1_NELNU|nr:TPA_asm: hypothetical protein HUJ06_004126 [Nelumbo nucifera]
MFQEEVEGKVSSSTSEAFTGNINVILSPVAFFGKNRWLEWRKGGRIEKSEEMEEGFLKEKEQDLDLDSGFGAQCQSSKPDPKEVLIGSLEPKGDEWRLKRLNPIVLKLMGSKGRS